MINTFYGLNSMDTTMAFFFALLIGLFFGVVLEKAGFGSSRRLAGIFYFRDMAVLKVMFGAVVTAMLGLIYCFLLGIIQPESVYFMPTIYGAQIIGGILLGIGFVMSGWCPGTAAVGLSSGKGDALVFLSGTILGSILFNETFHWIKPVYEAGDQGVIFVFDSLRMPRGVFAFLLTLLGIGAFWGAEWIEKKVTGKSEYWGTPFLKKFSFVLGLAALGVLLLSGSGSRALKPCSLAPQSGPASYSAEQSLMNTVEAAQDHIEPEELAERLMMRDTEVLLVDIRSAAEYAQFHIRGAVNMALQDLSRALESYRNRGWIVLYSNGMTHPAQARDSLFRLGFRNVYILTDGLEGFVERCLKPVSLRAELVPPILAGKIKDWRTYFLSREAPPAPAIQEATEKAAEELPKVVDSAWLDKNLNTQNLKIIDFRSQPEYNSGHIPHSFALNVESLRGVVGGVPSVLLPSEMLASVFSLMGIEREDRVILVYGDKLHDSTLAAMAFERLGHSSYAVLVGGFRKWQLEGLTLNTELPAAQASEYPPENRDHFTVNYQTVLTYVKNKKAVILDVRPVEYYSGEKTDEARAGHIPGAVNRPYNEDILQVDGYSVFKPLEVLEPAYRVLIPSKDFPIVVHCRTGHQASQTFFILKNLLGYKNVYWYDAGWTEWAARKELPIEKEIE